MSCGLAETVQFFKLEDSYTYHYPLETAQITENYSIICKKYLPSVCNFYSSAFI